MRKFIPAVVFKGVVLILALMSAAVAFYWMIKGRGPYPAIARFTGSAKLAFLVSWLITLACILPVSLVLRVFSKVPTLREHLRKELGNGLRR